MSFPDPPQLPTEIVVADTLSGSTETEAVRAACPTYTTVGYMDADVGLQNLDTVVLGAAVPVLVAAHQPQLVLG